MNLTNIIVVRLVVMVTIVVVPQTTQGSKKYVVGGIIGWSLPHSCTAYADWASHHKFIIGDVLAFVFIKGTDGVAEVTKEDFVNCNPRKPLRTSSVPVYIHIFSKGHRYFISTIPKHCIAGQKIVIQVFGITP